MLSNVIITLSFLQFSLVPEANMCAEKVAVETAKIARNAGVPKESQIRDDKGIENDRHFSSFFIWRIFFGVRNGII